jgi:hypothetical protein
LLGNLAAFFAAVGLLFARTKEWLDLADLKSESLGVVGWTSSMLILAVKICQTKCPGQQQGTG